MRQVLRDYQLTMLSAIQRYLEEEEGNGVVVSPTGTGKSLVCNAAIKWAVETYGIRVLCITHDAKIIAQNCASMLSYWPQARTGVYSAGLKQWNTTAPIIYCGVQSVHKCPEDFGKIDLLIVDECHMISPREGTMYDKVLKALKKTNPDGVRVLGFSASPYRMGQGLLVEGELFDDTVVDMTKTEVFCKFVDDGWLSPLHTKRTEAEIDLTNVPMQMGDFNEKVMEEVADTRDLNQCVVKEVFKYGADRNHWLGFCSGRKHAEHLQQAFTARGVEAVVIHGTMSMDERERLTNQFRSGRIRVVLNVGIFNVGWDFPELDLIFVVRGTQSTSWWVQCLGRGTRAVYAKGYPIETVEERLAAIAAGPKPNGCLILDFAGNTRRLGPVNDPVVPRARRKGDGLAGDAPVKVCPVCNEYCHTRATECPACGYKFPPSSCIETTAANDEVMVRNSLTPQIAMIASPTVFYSNRMTKNESLGEALRVCYENLAIVVSKYWFPQAPHDWMRRQFCQWWTQAGGVHPCPLTAEDAVSRARKELKVPVKVFYIDNKKHKELNKLEYSP